MRDKIKNAPRFEYLHKMGSLIHENSTGSAIIQAVFPKGWKPVQLIRFDWSNLQAVYHDLALFDLSIVTFDEHPYHIRSIEIDYEKKQISIRVGAAVTSDEETSL